MSLNPFAANPAIKARHEAAESRCGPALRAEVAALLTGSHPPAANAGGVVSRAEAERLVTAYRLDGVEALMLLLLPEAQKFAAPPISSFFVGAMGREAKSGDLILGGNVEFPGTHLGLTVHGEGFVATRAFSRGAALSAIAIGEAHPCAHCRQYLSEFAAGRELVLIDPLGHRLALEQLYPWPFDPAYLGEPGAVPGAVNWPALPLGRNDLPPETANALLAAGRGAHAPYSRCPGAVVLTLHDGSLVSGSAIESVAFNPTMAPLPAALIDLRAHGYAYSEIAAAALVTAIGGAVDYRRTTAELLAAIAPAAALTVVGWAASQ